MISKERLEELIEQGATIYGKYGDSYLLENREQHLSDFWYRQTVNIEDNKFHYTYEDSDYYEDIDVWFELEQLFETEEDARWELEMTATRTETLKLPTWEEFNNQDKLITFRTYPHNYHLLKYGKYIVIRAFYGQGGMDIFIKPLTKENYIEACKLAKRLFLGEKV